MRRLATCAGLALLPLSISHARTCRILFLGERTGAPETVQLFDGKKCQQTDLPRMNLSKTFHLPEGAITVSLLSAPPPENQPAPVGAPSAAIADGMDSLYLLVTPDASNKVLPLKIQVIDASSGNFKPGQMMWYNLTNLDVFGKLGEQNVSIKARAKTVTDAPIGKSGDYNVDLSYHLPNDKATYPICETRWVHDPNSRSIVFLLIEPGSKTPRVMSYRDLPEAQEKDKDKGANKP